MSQFSHRCAIALAGALALSALPAMAGPFAASVVTYDPGTIRSDYQKSASALGAPSPFTASSPFSSAYVVTPFNAPYSSSELTGIGPGGRLVLELGQTAETGHGFTLGVHAGVDGDRQVGGTYHVQLGGEGSPAL